MKLNYTVVISGPVYGDERATLAYQFVLALLKKGHSVHSLFFYMEGVSNASAYLDPANDEFHLLKAWETLKSEHNIPLNLCISAGKRRGIVPEQTLSNAFNITGLGALSEAIYDSDRTLQF